jgi:hypothetical protein
MLASQLFKITPAKEFNEDRISPSSIGNAL